MSIEQEYEYEETNSRYHRPSTTIVRNGCQIEVPFHANDGREPSRLDTVEPGRGVERLDRPPSLGQLAEARA